MLKYCHCKAEVPGISAAEISCTISWKVLVPNEEKVGVDGLGTGKVKSSDDESEQLDVASVGTSFGIEVDAFELEVLTIIFISEIWFDMQCIILSHARSDWYYQNNVQVDIRCYHRCIVSVKSASPSTFPRSAIVFPTIVIHYIYQPGSIICLFISSNGRILCPYIRTTWGLVGGYDIYAYFSGKNSHFSLPLY